MEELKSRICVINDGAVNVEDWIERFIQVASPGDEIRLHSCDVIRVVPFGRMVALQHSRRLPTGKEVVVSWEGPHTPESCTSALVRMVKEVM